jgi:heptaprenyl diphosphate synthase
MTDFWKESPLMADSLAEVEAILLDTLTDSTYPLQSQTKDLVLSGGKMLRPAFVILGSQFGPPRKAKAAAKKIPYIASALELLHTATLVHDDVLDNAEFRRGIPTLHTKFGTVNAILAGDWLFSKSFRLVAEWADQRSARILARFVGQVCSAEINQDIGKFSFSTSRREYLRTIAGKTAALFSLALHVGAFEAGCDLYVTQTLRRAGYDIGMAFQIIDDILDYESDDATLKKPVGNDLREGLCTLPLTFAMERDPELRPLLVKAGKSGLDDNLIDAVVRRVAETQALERAKEVARGFTARARKEIENLPNRPAKKEFSQLCDKLLARTY